MNFEEEIQRKNWQQLKLWVHLQVWNVLWDLMYGNFKIFHLVYANKLIVILWRYTGIIIYFIKMSIILQHCKLNNVENYFNLLQYYKNDLTPHI
jgi:hypothetical protein